MSKTIVFAGDSFSAGPVNLRHLFDVDWTKRLAKKLDLKYVNLSKGGSSWWTARQRLVQYLKTHETPEVVVITHTEPYRLPNRKHLKINGASVYEKNSQEFKAGRMYYEQLFDEKFHEWSQQQWFKECTSLTSSKIVHLKCFEDSNEFEFSRGAIIHPALSTISLLEFENNDKSNLSIQDHRTNHFSNNNNEELANQLYKIITNYEDKVYNLDLSSFELFENVVEK